MSGEWGLTYIREHLSDVEADVALLLGGGGPTSWGLITGTLAAQIDLQAALDGKTAVGHVHTIANVTGLQAALDGKQAAGSYQPLATVLTNTTAAFTTAQETKLSGIATGATANSSDATLLARANHTGTQSVSTITGLGTLATQSGTFSGTSSGTNTGDQTITLTGDVTGSGGGSFAATLATVNSNVGAFGSSTLIPVVTVNAKGLITAISTVAASGGGGGGSVNSGTATVNFGAFPGSTDTSVAVTGQTGILAGSIVQAWIRPAVTADHSEMDHIVDPPRIVAGEIVAGVGFTIRAFTENTRRHHGEYAVQWTWS